MRRSHHWEITGATPWLSPWDSCELNNSGFSASVHFQNCFSYRTCFRCKVQLLRLRGSQMDIKRNKGTFCFELSRNKNEIVKTKKPTCHISNFILCLISSHTEFWRVLLENSLLSHNEVSFISWFKQLHLLNKLKLNILWKILIENIDRKFHLPSKCKEAPANDIFRRDKKTLDFDTPLTQDV